MSNTDITVQTRAKNSIIVIAACRCKTFIVRMKFFTKYLKIFFTEGSSGESIKISDLM